MLGGDLALTDTKTLEASGMSCSPQIRDPGKSSNALLPTNRRTAGGETPRGSSGHHATA